MQFLIFFGVFFSFVKSFVIQRGQSSVMVLPGLGGSRLYYNNTNHQKTLLWPIEKFSFSSLYEMRQLQMSYDIQTHQFISNGNSVFTDPIGDSMVLRNICFQQERGQYVQMYDRLLDELQNRFDHVVACPYDFRRIEDEKYMTRYFEELRTVFMTSEMPFVVVTHSLGSLLFHDFLTLFLSESEKQKYIQHWIPLFPPFLGSYKVIDILQDIRIKFIKHRCLISGGIRCLPNYYIFDSPSHYDEVLGTTGILREILDRKLVSKFQNIRVAPGVSTTIVYSASHPTKCDKQTWQRGDCTVTMESATRIATLWRVEQTPQFPIHIFEVPNIHSDLSNIIPLLVPIQ